MSVSGVADGPVTPEPVQPAPPAPPAAARERSRFGRWARSEVAPALEILALCGLGIAQPLLEITGRSPDFFLFYGAQPPADDQPPVEAEPAPAEEA